MAAQRIYVVTNGNGRQLVRASSQAQAIRHIVSTEYSAEVAKPDDIVELMTAGVQVQTAGEEAQAELFGEDLGA